MPNRVRRRSEPPESVFESEREKKKCGKYPFFS
jgi:hypothetical protein